MHPEQKIAKKLVSQHTIILVTTITEILSSAIVFIRFPRFNTSKCKSASRIIINNLAVSVGSSVSDNCRKF